MAYKYLLIDREDNIAVLTINRPDKYNALNDEVVAEISAAADELASDGEVRAIVITGAGEKAFISGADVGMLQEMTSSAQAVANSRRGQAMTLKIESMRKPVIAAINGYALGGGLELAMACDIRIAAETARVGQPEIGLGVSPGYGGTQRLPRLVGKGMAKLLILSGDMIDAQEALRIGLVQRVVPWKSYWTRPRPWLRSWRRSRHWPWRRARRPSTWGWRWIWRGDSRSSRWSSARLPRPRTIRRAPQLSWRSVNQSSRASSAQGLICLDTQLDVCYNGRMASSERHILPLTYFGPKVVQAGHLLGSGT